MLFDQQNDPNTPKAPIIPAMEFLVKSFQYCWENRKDFIALALLPITVLTFTNTLLAHFFPAPIIMIDPEAGNIQLNEYRLLSLPVSLLLQSMFSVAAFRYLLVREEDLTIYAAIKWDRYKTAFLSRFIKIMGVFIVVSLGGFTVLGLLLGGIGPNSLPLQFLTLVLIFLIFYAKFMMALPAAAIGDPLDLKESWKMTEGNVWRIISLTALPFIPISMLSLIVGNIMDSIFGFEQVLESLTLKFIYGFATEFLSYVYVAIMTVAIGYSYQFLKSKYNGSVH